MPDRLYDRDIVAWADQQADTLERLARGVIYQDAIHDVGQAGMSVPKKELGLVLGACPYQLDDFVSARPSTDDLLSRLPF